MIEARPGRLYFSTEMLPERDRFAAFCEEFARRYLRLDIAVRDDRPFRGISDLRQTGVVDVGFIDASPTDFLRTPTLIRDGEDALIIGLVLSGTAHSSQIETAPRVVAGEAIFNDGARLGGFHADTDIKAWCLKVHRGRLGQLLPDLDRRVGQKLHANSASLGLLFGYLNGTKGLDLASDEPAAQLFGNHLLDIIAFAFGASGEARELAEQFGVRAARRAAVVREIEQHASDVNFNVAAVAALLDVSPRYIQVLLEETGKTFSTRVLEKRLKNAATLLGDPRNSKLKIAEIAFAAGFSDLSNFNRCFRRYFGDTPSGMRAKTSIQTRSTRSTL